MKETINRKSVRSQVSDAAAAGNLLLLAVLIGAYAAGCDRGPTVAGFPAAKALELGEKMYRNGVLPSGDHIQAEVPGGVAIPGTTFACISCHTRSGLGTMNEGGLRTLPVNGAKLFQPLYPNFQSLTSDERAQMVPARFQAPPLRPAYTDATLATAIKDGTNPKGRRFSPVMPRYRLNDRDMKILIHYLKNLSARFSPGVTETSLSFATVVTEDVPAADREAVLGLLDLTFQSHNNLGRNPGHMVQALGMRAMAIGYVEWNLTRWILRGPSDTWQRQLEEYYSRGPVFALVGGLSTGGWEPIHKFCEKFRIPCILPLTELPVISESDYYTVYFSKGYYQEGEAAARYVQGIPAAERSGGILQVAGPGPEAAALARGFNETWSGMGNGNIETIFLKSGPMPDAALPAGAAGKGENSILLLWTGPETYAALRTLGTSETRPGTVLMSSSLLSVKLWGLPEEARSFTFVTYPFARPGRKSIVPKMGGRPIVLNRELRRDDRRISSTTRTAGEILFEVLFRMERNFYRDHLLDLIDMKEDLDATDYEKLTFGPGKRYLADGCYIMQLSGGTEPSLIQKSDWNFK